MFKNHVQSPTVQPLTTSLSPAAHRYLGTYLNDHLAGSVVALELLDWLERSHSHSDLGQFVAGLKRDIIDDRQELEALMGRLEIHASPPRKAAAWLAEKMTELKLNLDDPEGGLLRILEALEAVAIGIDGKRALWRSLTVASQDQARLQGTDYRYLEQRAQEQRDRVETVRLKAAREAFCIPREDNGSSYQGHNQADS